MLTKVLVDKLGVLGGEDKSVKTGELSPTEAVGTESVAVLGLDGEEENSLLVLGGVSKPSRNSDENIEIFPI